MTRRVLDVVGNPLTDFTIRVTLEIALSTIAPRGNDQLRRFCNGYLKYPCQPK